MARADEIDRLNEGLEDITLPEGVEVDMLANCQLDLPDSALQWLDVVVASVHSHFDLSQDRQTVRMQRALDRPFVHLLAHPTGRLIGRREGYSVDMARLVRHTRARGCSLELNAKPQCLDLCAVY